MLCLMLMGAFQGIQGGDGDGQMMGPFLRAGAERGGTEWTRGRDNPEDAPRTGVGLGVAEWR